VVFRLHLHLSFEETGWSQVYYLLCTLWCGRFYYNLRKEIKVLQCPI